MLAQDTTPPELTGLMFSPTVVNTTTTAATVTLTAQATDDLSGVSWIGAYFYSPSRAQEQVCSLSLISGSGLNGTWRCQLTMPAYSESGTWTMNEVYTTDKVSNVKVYYTSDLQA
jgi:hypothetical protein